MTAETIPSSRLESVPPQSPETSADTSENDINPWENLYTTFSNFVHEQSPELSVGAIEPRQAHDFLQVSLDFVAERAPIIVKKIKSIEDAEATTPHGIIPVRMVRNKISYIYRHVIIEPNDSFTRKKHIDTRVNTVPTAYTMRDRFPEISYVYAIKGELVRNGNEQAADNLNDLLMAYGMVIQDLRRAAGQRALEKQHIR